MTKAKVLKGGKALGFGGHWTEQKLLILKKYLHAYAVILKNTRFKFAYIDAFAGCGFRTESVDEDTKKFIAGSAMIALESEPKFQHYIFFEKSSLSLIRLKDAVSEKYPELTDCIKFESGDSNWHIKQMCKKNWAESRAILFLDPFGMQVDWTTIQSIAKTKAIDLLVLFPIGVAVNRMLTKNGEIETSWKTHLNRVFGTSSWFERFYEDDHHKDLFDDNRRLVKTANIDAIMSFYLERLSSIFPHVVSKPLYLCNNKGAKIFALIFAAANPGSGGKVAVKIATDILGGSSGALKH